jgi:hypothetical protein
MITKKLLQSPLMKRMLNYIVDQAQRNVSLGKHHCNHHCPRNTKIAATIAARIE